MRRISLKYTLVVAGLGIAVLLAVMAASRWAPHASDAEFAAEVTPDVDSRVQLLRLHDVAAPALAMGTAGALDELNDHLRRVAADAAVAEVLVADPQGRVVAASDRDVLGEAPPRPEPEGAPGWLLIPLEHAARRVGMLALRFNAIPGALAAHWLAGLLATAAGLLLAGLLLWWDRDGPSGFPRAQSDRATEAHGPVARLLAEGLRRLEVAEASRLRSERNLRLLMAHTSDGILAMDRGLRILDANPSFCRMLGYAREELTGLPYAQLLAPGEEARRPLALLNVDKGHRVSMERRYRRKDGSVIPCELSGVKVDEDLSYAIIRDITQRKAAEAELAKREHEYRLVLEESFDAILLIDRDKTLLEVNRRACEMLGYTREELLGRDYRTLVDPQDLERLPLMVGAVFEGRRMTFERRYVCKDGSRVDVELSAKRIDDYRMQTVVRDITERKRAEAALRESEALSRALLGAAFDGILIHDDGVILEANPAFERIFGYPRSELVGRDCTELLIAPESLPAVRQSRRSDDRLPVEAVGVRKDGQRIHLEMVSASHTYQGRAARVSAVRDITPRKVAEEVLRESEARLREAQRIANLGSWEWDVATDRFTGSENLARLLGFPPGVPSGTGTEALNYVHPDDRPRAAAEIASMVTENRFFGAVDCRIVRPDGQVRECHCRMRPERDANGRTVRLLGITQDVTEHRELERRLAQAQKMEAVGQLTGGVAHDFNNLLTIVLGNLRLMERAGHDDDPLLQEAVQAVERGSHVVQRLLTYSRRQPLHTEALVLNELIGETTELLRRTLGETIEVETQLADDLWLARTDRSQMETALINLALNARDAMPEGGRLCISTENVSAARAASGAPRRRPGDFVRVSVSDTGRGMAPDMLERVFEPFFTTKEVGRGTGLGLSMVYGFVQQCGGFVEVRSAPQQGTVVELMLPRVRASARPPVEVRCAAEAGQGETVLLVEDDPAVRKATRRMLDSLGYRVVDAPDGTEALRLMPGLPAPALLLTDLVMPRGMNGAELAQAAQQLRPGLRVLLMTGHVPVQEMSEPAPLWPLLRKPYSPDELQQRLRDVLHGEPSASSDPGIA